MNRTGMDAAGRSRAARVMLALSCLALLALPLQAGATAGGEAKSGVEKVDLNRASEQELMAVPGIGKTMAERIVAFRDDHGPFERVEDLMKVKGIGEKSLQKLKSHFLVARRKK